VSFALALRVALQAYDVPAREQWPLLQTCGRRFLKSPGEFLLPPRRNR
jgi:site-specific recombinase